MEHVSRYRVSMVITYMRIHVKPIVSNTAGHMAMPAMSKERQIFALTACARLHAKKVM